MTLWLIVVFITWLPANYFAMKFIYSTAMQEFLNDVVAIDPPARIIVWKSPGPETR